MFRDIQTGDVIVGAWTDIGIGIVFAPLVSRAMAVTYYLLRSGKEQVDVKEIAAAFDLQILDRRATDGRLRTAETNHHCCSSTT